MAPTLADLSQTWEKPVLTAQFMDMDAEAQRRARLRLARAVRQFRVERKLTPRMIHDAFDGPDPRTQAKIERGEYVYAATLRKLAEAAGWKYESRYPVEDGLVEELAPANDNQPEVSAGVDADVNRFSELESLLVRIPQDIAGADRVAIKEQATRVAQDAVNQMIRKV